MAQRRVQNKRERGAVYFTTEFSSRVWGMAPHTCRRALCLCMNHFCRMICSTRALSAAEASEKQLNFYFSPWENKYIWFEKTIHETSNEKEKKKNTAILLCGSKVWEYDFVLRPVLNCRKRFQTEELSHSFCIYKVWKTLKSNGITNP